MTNKGDLITSKPHYNNAIEALLDDYSSNKIIYKELFNETKANHSITHQFLEGMYIKYSRSLERYMRDNKANMKLSGNKKYENVPIDLFIKESKAYKDTIITELHNKYNKEESKTSALASLNNLFLTPLPNKPRVLLNTQQEKDEFQTAERLAVVMRTVEYTNALKNQGNQYYAMQKEERQEMIYILKRATEIIQDWWKKTDKGNLSKRKRNRKCNRVVKEIRVNIMPSYYRIRVIGSGWEYISKQYGGYNSNNINSQDKDKSKGISYKESIVLIQKHIRALLNRKAIHNRGLKALSQILRIKESNNTTKLLKALLRWISILYYNKDSNNLKAKLKKVSFNINTLGYNKLASSIIKAFKQRLLPLFSNMRSTQSKHKALERLQLLLKKGNCQLAFKTIKKAYISNLLLKILTKRNRLNFLWKYFSIWNILNILIHLFINKLEHCLRHSIMSSFISLLHSRAIIGNDQYIDDLSEYNSILHTNTPSTYIKKIRYSNIKANSISSKSNLFPVYKGLQCLEYILAQYYFKKVKQYNTSIQPKQQTNYDNDKGDDNDIQIYHPSTTYTNQLKSVLFPHNIKDNEDNEGDYTNKALLSEKNTNNNPTAMKKGRVVIKSMKKFDTIERIDNNESDLELFKLKQYQGKESENIINFSHLTNKILTDSSAMKIDSSISHYTPYNKHKESQLNSVIKK